MELVERGWSDVRIGRELGVSGAAVKLARRRYRLKPKTQVCLTARTVAQRLGISCAKTIAWWIESGWLKGRRGWAVGTNRSWIIDEEDLLNFLADPDHFHRWDPQRIPDKALREYAERHRAGVRFLTLSEVAERMFVQRGTVAQWIDKGYLPAVRNGRGNRRVREGDVAAFQLPRLGGRKRMAA